MPPFSQDNGADSETVRAQFARTRRMRAVKSQAARVIAGLTVILAIALAFLISPIGGDGSLAATVAVRALAIGCAAAALLTVFMIEPAPGTELADVWRSLLGRSLVIRNRHQFRARLLRECKQAGGNKRAPLSLVLIRVSGRWKGTRHFDPRAAQQVAHVIVASTRFTDVIGVVEDDEIGVIASDAGARGRDVIVSRLRQQLAAALPGMTASGALDASWTVSIGASTFSAEDSLESLISNARYSLAPVEALVADAA